MDPLEQRNGEQVLKPLRQYDSRSGPEWPARSGTSRFVPLVPLGCQCQKR